MYTLKKSLGFWCVNLTSSGKTMFRSLSRATASDWKAANEPAVSEVAQLLNAAIGVNVWH